MQPITLSSSKHFVKASLLAGLLLCVSNNVYGQAGGANALPPGDGKDLLVEACTTCHALTPIVILRDGPAGWKYFVNEMVLRGAQLSPREAETLIQYLVKNFGPNSPPVGSGGQGAASAKVVSLPAGPGKELVESRCGSCHDLGIATTLKRTREEWDRVVKDMVARGTPGNADEIKAMTSYLTAQFGK